ncbi:hypothetical protein, variant [Verruconis gallopava]|uniref:Uncharacterized protein n=1 Tax=Verruconis gallopava TaxID=253628 RepID=A0A0D2AVV2_9PEZI|nr:uncharacterized protein PV09_05511 [Verruconis gallopava]XP_016213169.1 hypothetical protein, variant [Verruconis gallopava]KIW03299.1 hypothetical protein PV09_05511 [Verruconis gallopava]KIW03300.1 hypothetical protein, variant [Verruconis gallopava]
MAPNLKNIRFGRRKSQGNSIDEGSPAAPVSSFRVIPREDAAKKSTSSALDLRKAATFQQPSRQPSYEYDSGSSNRGSNSSASTAPRSHLSDNPNTRFSSSSTLQSPVEAMKKDRSPSPHFLKLGEDFDSDWGDLFSSMDKRKSGVLNDSSSRPLTLGRGESEPILSNPPKAFANNQRATHPSPPLGYSREMTASPPTQWARRTSGDRLISSPDLGSADSPTDDDPPPLPPKHTTVARDSKPYSYGLLSDSADLLDEPPSLAHSTSVRSQNSFTRSGVNEDTDAALVQQSVRAMRASTLERSGVYESSPLARKEVNTSESLAPPPSRPLNGSSDTSLKTTSSSSSFTHQGESGASSPSNGTGANKNDSARSTPRATPAEPARDGTEMFDPEVMQAIHQANHQSDNRQMLGLPTESPPRLNGAKVMTMADFNKAKANTLSTFASKSADEGSDDGYEDDDDDPQIQAQKKRLEAQREAQHAIWRQKMKKAIGDQSTLPPMRPDFLRANQSAPSLTFNGEPQPEEEDEDVPLAILQAHNFPSKSKTPDPRLSQHSYIGIQDRPSSPARNSTTNQRASQLPVFARRLPEDPYFGSSDLSTPVKRESLAFNKGRAQSMYGAASGPPPGVSPVPGIPPGGLVGVIASEEQARGARRGSPNPQTAMGFNMPGVGTLGGALPMQLPSAPINPVSQSDMLRNQQMLELMQQNNLMMKEMMEMRAQMQMMQMGGQMPMGPQGMPMAGLPQQNRPMSIIDQNLNRQSMAPSMYGRTMSFLGPAPNMFLNQPAAVGSGARSVMNVPVGNFGRLNDGYTPSIAPSERSNIGQPARYKPVNFGDGGSTVTAGSTLKLSQAQTGERKKSGFLSAVIHQGKKSTSKGKEDDDDEEAWGTVRRRR